MTMNGAKWDKIPPHDKIRHILIHVRGQVLRLLREDIREKRVPVRSFFLCRDFFVRTEEDITKLCNECERRERNERGSGKNC